MGLRNVFAYFLTDLIAQCPPSYVVLEINECYYERAFLPYTANKTQIEFLLPITANSLGYLFEDK